MKFRSTCVLAGFFALVLSMAAQTSVSTGGSASQLPRLVKFSGTLKDGNGNALTGVVGLTFALYSEQTGGAPLWIETQNVQSDKNGHYTVMLGETKLDGMPVELFASEQAQWLGVQPENQLEQPRVMLVSVPYALKAVDADTLGGKPASAYTLAAPAATTPGTAERAIPSAQGKASASPAGAVTGTGTIDYVPLWTSSSALGKSVLYQSGTEIGINTTTPGATLGVKGNGIFTANSNTEALQVTQAGGTGGGIVATTNSTNGIGAQGISSSTTKSVTGGIGVYGFSSNPSGYGVEGTSGNIGVAGNGGSIGGSTGTGVQGLGDQFGVYGATNDLLFPAYQVGVYGTTNSASATAYGVEGIAASTTGSPVGVYGLSSSPNGYGVEGVSGHVGVLGDAGASTSGYGVEGIGANVGVFGSGTGSGGIGVDAHGTIQGAKGIATATSGAAQGVYGQTSSPGGYGVEGTGPTIGVYGTASGSTGHGVEGTSPNVGVSGASHGASATGAGHSPAKAGIWGDTGGAAGSGYTGVLGTADENSAGWFLNNGPYPAVVAKNSSFGYGVQGEGPNVGVYGSSAGASVRGANFGNAGVWGDTAGGPNYGVLGTADKGYAGVFENNGEHPALYAQNNSSTGALVFWALGSGGDGCTVDTSGNLVCNGNITNAVALDGGARKVALYAMQSADNWFEDAGSGQLSNGSARIELDPTFAKTVNARVEYHVFLTPKGDSKGLYVSNETPQGFEVHEQRGGHSSIAFDYRIMAKRVGYEKVHLQDLTEQFNKQEAQRQDISRSVRPSAAPGSTR
jgi:hypothetical protein